MASNHKVGSSNLSGREYLSLLSFQEGFLLFVGCMKSTRCHAGVMCTHKNYEVRFLCLKSNFDWANRTDLIKNFANTAFSVNRVTGQTLDIKWTRVGPKVFVREF